MTLDVKWKKRLIQSVWGAERFHTVTDCSVSKSDYPWLAIQLSRRTYAVAGEGEEKTVSRRSTVRSIFPEKVGIVFKEEMVPQSLFLPSFSSSTTHIVVPSMDTWRECWVDLRVDLPHPDKTAGCWIWLYVQRNAWPLCLLKCPVDLVDEIWLSRAKLQVEQFV